MRLARAEALDSSISQLRNSSEYRTRIHAALLLGESQDKRAVAPLCEALDDENENVRGAAAAALGKLQLGGLDCLEAQLADEDSDWDRMLIERSIERLKVAQTTEPASRLSPALQRLQYPN